MAGPPRRSRQPLGLTMLADLTVATVTQLLLGQTAGRATARPLGCRFYALGGARRARAPDRPCLIGSS
jgi:hypothetical protein